MLSLLSWLSSLGNYSHTLGNVKCVVKPSLSILEFAGHPIYAQLRVFSTLRSTVWARRVGSSGYGLPLRSATVNRTEH